MVLPTRQAPAQHASRDVADVLEAVDDVARDEDDAAGTGCGGLIADGHLIEALDDEQKLFLFEMGMVGRAFAGLVPRRDDRGGAAGGLGSEQHVHVEAERLDRQRLFGRNDSGLQWGWRVHVCCLQFFMIFWFGEAGIAGTSAVSKSSGSHPSAQSTPRLGRLWLCPTQVLNTW